jgi:hypothetical protein
MTIRTLLVLLTLSLFACAERAYWPDRTFNSEEWKNAPVSQRYEFANDLLNRGLLNGMTKGEVVEVLGHPDGESANPPSMFYVLKQGGSFMNQVYILDIRFLADGSRVMAVGVRGD